MTNKRYSRASVAEESEAPEVVQATVESEEESFKKRYGDLRRYMQQTVETKDKELEKLKKEIKTKTKEEFKLPTSEEEIETWAGKYPEVAKIVDSIAQKRAREASQEVEQSMSDLRKMKSQLEKEKAEHQLKQIHPDFDTIRADTQFHQWVKAQPKYLQDALYKNEDDAVAAGRAIDLFKADMGMLSSASSNSQLTKEAARSIKKAGNNSPSASPNAEWSESKVDRLKAYEYEKYEKEILNAMQAKKFVYDMSGGAR